MLNRITLAYTVITVCGATLGLTIGGTLLADRVTTGAQASLISRLAAEPAAQPDRQPARQTQERQRRLRSSTEIPEHAVDITTDETHRYVKSNGIPDHTPGAFPNRNNPNAISGQEYQYRVPLNPEAAEELTALERQPIGIAVNGVPFDPGTAENYKNDPSTGWRLEAFNSVFNLGLDSSNAHVQPTGAYHYHGIPNDLLKNLKASENLEMILLGYAADGFPIYNAVAHADPEDAGSELIELEPGYALLEGERPVDDNTPPGVYNGDYTRDWEFDQGHGDLDEANGTFGVTPEYPEGTYYYTLTEAFPYMPRFFRGTPDASFERRGPGGQGADARAGRNGQTGRPEGQPTEGRRPRGSRPGG